MALGTDNLKKVLLFVINLAEKVDEITADGVTWTDALALLPNVVEGVGVLKSGKEAWREFQDLDDTEKDDVLDYIKTEFDIDDEDVEELVDSAFETIFAVADTIEKAKILLKKE